MTLKNMKAVKILLTFVPVDALCPSQQFFSHVGTISCLPLLNQYDAVDKVSCSSTQHSAVNKNISILHWSCRTSDLQFSLVLQTHVLDL